MAKPLSGRRAQAARNDEIILRAARQVFGRDPGAPISTVAHRAGVGISALYRRYPSKDELLHQLSLDGLMRYNAILEAALDNPAAPWDVFTDFMENVVAADTHALVHLSVGFTQDEEIELAARKSHLLSERLFERIKRANVLRVDITLEDWAVIHRQLSAINFGDTPERTQRLRRRYLALVLDAMRLPNAAPLPGPPPRFEELNSHPDVQQVNSPQLKAVC
ncbi:MAG: TetR/AcrR family transcriptional regulator [Corynebacteriales bacterium]|nr:TetR/AcrR family transcriptional regulator [Mycobacteriales bacterium]